MPTYLSAFTPCGLLELSSKPSRAELHYRDQIDAYGSGYDFTPGEYMEASVYAKSMAYARARVKLSCAGNQRKPLKAYEMLPGLEKDYGVVPGPNDTVPMRQAAVAARMLLQRGAIFESVVDGLRNILGADFLAYRPLDSAEAHEFPTWPSSDAALRSNPTLPTTAEKLCKLVDPVGIIGSPYTVAYENLDPTAGEVLLSAGDVVMVQPENGGLSEKVTVTSVAGGGKVQRTLTATFQFGHDDGAVITTGSWPYQWSTQRFAMIVVTSVAAIDAEKRRKVNEQMQRVARGVSTWAIVERSSPTTIGPFQIGISPLGTTPIGTFTYVPSP